MPAASIRRLWLSLHEPRKIAAAMVALYSTCFVVGAMMVFGHPMSILPPPFNVIEGVILMIAGVVGAPTAWRGCWRWERVAVAAFGGVGVVLAACALVDAFHGFFTADITVSWVLGLAAWLNRAYTRWAKITERPYAPGHGPVPVGVHEREAALMIRLSEEVVAGTGTR